MKYTIRGKWLEGGQDVTMIDPISSLIESRNYQRLNAITDAGKEIHHNKVDFKYYYIDVSEAGNKLYKELTEELKKDIPNIGIVTFLTGSIHTLRIMFDYQVPEIESSFIKIGEAYGKEVQCLLMLYM